MFFFNWLNFTEVKRLFISFLCALAFQVYAQERSIELLVRDAKTRETLPFCHVCTEDLEHGDTKYVTTDNDGKASIPFRGKTVISISFIGYETILDTIAR